MAHEPQVRKRTSNAVVAAEIAAALRQGNRVVVHVGDTPDSPAGGVSRVIRTHLNRTFDDLHVACIPSFDPLPSSLFARQVPALTGLITLLRLGSMRKRDAVLHVHMSDRLSVLREGAFCLVGRLLGWRVCVTRHASNSLNRRRVLSDLAVRVALAPATVVHLLSEEHASTAPVGADRLVVIPNDVEGPGTVVPMAERQPAVVFAGEFGYRKGADVLLAAWAGLDAGVKAGWTLEAFGRVDPSVVPAAAEDDGSVRIHGLASGEVVNQALLSSAVAVLPSREEALPMFVLEAMSAGCAVVATDVGAVASVLGDDGGEIVAPGDADALREALAVLMTSPERRARLAGAAHRRFLAGYDAAVITARWQALYLRLLR